MKQGADFLDDAADIAAGGGGFVDVVGGGEFAEEGVSFLRREFAGAEALEEFVGVHGKKMLKGWKSEIG